MNGDIQYLSVKQLNEYVKLLLDSDPLLGSVWVRAEISNFKHHYATGHLYFSLKDEEGLVRAVMFRFQASKLVFEPKDGMKVLVHGRVSSFVRDGQYQLYVDEMLPDGRGALYFAFEQLKAKLETEGLFDEARKKPLPRFPESIGIITSPTGAAIRDMINILSRRYPCASLYLYPAQVQGPEAPAQLIRGLRFFNERKKTDVIIIGRGGGSVEDLWAFNNEELARMVAASHIPVISAVGHESDFTICDFVADLRAPTPSAAAELAVPDRLEWKSRFLATGDRMLSLLSQKIERGRLDMRRLAESGPLSSPGKFTENARMTLYYLSEKADGAMAKRLADKQAALGRVGAKLEALSPLSVLARGYGIAAKESGEVIRSVGDVQIGETAVVSLHDGKIHTAVTAITTERKTKNGKNSKKL